MFLVFCPEHRSEVLLSTGRIEAITPRGKALLTRFDSGWTLYSHNQLYGVWKVGKPSDPPHRSRSLRVELATARAAIRLYSASDVTLWRSEEIDAHPFLQRIGPHATQALKQRVANELKTTFASRYSREITLPEALQRDVILAYCKRATGAKFLIHPNRGL